MGDLTPRPGCWCNQPHDWDDPPNATEALRNLGHLLITETHIPQLVEWLERKLRRRGS